MCTPLREESLASMALEPHSLRNESLEAKARQSNSGLAYSTDEDLSSIQTEVLYVPESSNRLALDSFILLDGFYASSNLQPMEFTTFHLGSLTRL
jgi:hypothetical protein